MGGECAARGATSVESDLSARDPGGLEICCLAYGVPFQVRIRNARPGNASWHQAVLDCLPHGTTLRERALSGTHAFTVTGELPDGAFRTHAGEELTGVFADQKSAFDQLSRDVMIHVANYAPDRVFVHAGVVAVRGRGLMFPGTSFAGKTTLVAALVRAGATYYSDEYAIVDQGGLVFPYSRDLQVRMPGQSMQCGVPVTALCGVAGSAPIAIRHVVFAQYEAGARWSPKSVTAGMAVLEMLRHSIPVQRTPARVLSTLSNLMNGANAWQSKRGDTAEVVPFLLELMSKPH